MILEIGIYRLDIDVNRTKSYYSADYVIGCDCDGCRNFVKAANRMPEDVKIFLRKFGIDPGKPAEVSAVHSPDGCETLYSGFYHICGTILEGTEPWVKVSKKQFRLDERYAIPLSGDFSFFFTANCHLLAPDFPLPAIQLEFTGYLPWVLDEPNPYV